MNGALHPRADVDRRYMTRGQGGRGWMSVKDEVRVEKQFVRLFKKSSGQFR